MTTAKVKSIKATVVFPADQKPDISPEDPRIRIEMEGGLTVLAKVMNPPLKGVGLCLYWEMVSLARPFPVPTPWAP